MVYIFCNMSEFPLYERWARYIGGKDKYLM